MILAYKYRLLPNRRQYKALADISEAQRQLYNAALEERIDCYRKTGKSLSYDRQSASLTIVRQDDQTGYGAVPVSLSRCTLMRLSRAFDAFFRRVKSGDAPGFPRFKGAAHWRGFGFSQWMGVRFDGRRLRFKGMPGGLRVHMHRNMPTEKIASCHLSRDVNGWFVSFQTEVRALEKKTIQTAVGIDVGLSAFAFQSDGIAVPAPQIARRKHRRQKLLQRALARCKRGSGQRRKVRAALAGTYADIANNRRTWLHQVSARIAKAYDLIAVEDLNVAGMLRNKQLSRSISDAAWATFTKMLGYKAENAGGTFIKVDPKLTSQICSGCGEIVRKGLSDRVHNCPICGLVLDRDHNAALNILRRAVLRPGEANVAGCRKRSRGNLKAVTP